MADIETISYIRLSDGENHPIDAVTVEGKTVNQVISQAVNSGLVTSIDANSDDSHYPSAKCMYDIIGNIESRLSNI